MAEVVFLVSTERVIKLMNRLAKKFLEGGFTRAVCTVGFTAAYAIYIHEKLEMKWKGLPRGSKGIIAGFRSAKRLSLERAAAVSALQQHVSIAKRTAKDRSPEKRAMVAKMIRDEFDRMVADKTLIKASRKKGQAPIHRGFYWDPQGQAQPKFLEQPFREMRQELIDMIQEVTVKTGNLQRGLQLAGLRLQREAQQRVPVEFGNLKGSAFTRVELE